MHFDSRNQEMLAEVFTWLSIIQHRMTQDDKVVVADHKCQFKQEWNQNMPIWGTERNLLAQRSKNLDEGCYLLLVFEKTEKSVMNVSGHTFHIGYQVWLPAQRVKRISGNFDWEETKSFLPDILGRGFLPQYTLCILSFPDLKVLLVGPLLPTLSSP